MFFGFLILKSKISTIKTNEYGEMTSPWGTPSSRLIFSDAEMEKKATSEPLLSAERINTTSIMTSSKTIPVVTGCNI